MPLATTQSLSPEIERMLAEVSLEAPWELTERFASMPRCLPADVNRACDLLTQRLQAHNVPVEVLTARLYLSLPLKAEVWLDGQTLIAKPSSFSMSVPQGMVAELIYVPATYSASISTLFQRNTQTQPATDRLRGRIVVSEGYATPAKMREFELAGAAGVIAINPGQDVHWGTCTTIWGAPELDDLPRKPRIPVVAVNHSNGQLLIAAAAAGRTVRLNTELEEGWFDQKLPVVNIPGTDPARDFVLLHGHYDSWDVGVGDNATGDATLLEIARVLWQHRAQMHRSVRIAWWPGHSTGRYAGSTWFADNFAEEIDEYCVAQINCDSPGCRWATEYSNVSWMAETESFAQSTIAAVTGVVAHGERPHRAGDYAFNNIGVSSLMMLSSTMPEALRQEKNYYTVGGCGGNIAWHTESDTLEVADPQVMLQDIRVYLSLVVGIANATVLPFDWRALTREFAGTLERYQRLLGEDYNLSATQTQLSQLEAAMDMAYESTEAGRLQPSVTNTMIRRLARVLVPINHTLGPRFSHDMASAMPALPSLALANRWTECPPEHRDFALTQLRRGDNKLQGALRQALCEVHTALRF